MPSAFGFELEQKHTSKGRSPVFLIAKQSVTESFRVVLYFN